ncbi:MAG: hypothetical protein KKG10_12565 [Proteobacteria bacterium]|nr:hypothetical protein [Pseudomonadota bacterium]
MKKLRTITIPVAGKDFSLYGYGFTIEEALEIKEALKDYDTKAVIAFLLDVEEICTRQIHLKPIKGVSLTKADISAEKKKMIGHFQKARKDIENLLDNKIKLAYLETVNDTLLEDMSDVEIFERYRERLLTAYYSLEEISAFLSISIEEKKGAGRTPADSTDFIKTIIGAYEKHIDRPTTYRDGPFFQCLQVILKSVNLPHKDPSRAIQAALK